ncbi:hypothetical protein AMELA_G00053400 [Ameiurus melas]|uniref:Uncharacterized protein n=1 Tax=Ameiurus melas TaxID=219545 RepID=A0A7J6B6M5_AMEME|nr:hypothetical protein AMELA_G00053400 [Ameiurus melas]
MKICGSIPTSGYKGACTLEPAYQCEMVTRGRFWGEHAFSTGAKRELHSLHSSFISTRLSTVTTRASDVSGNLSQSSTGKSYISSVSDSESEGNDSMDGATNQIPRIVITSESGLILSGT